MLVYRIAHPKTLIGPYRGIKCSALQNMSDTHSWSEVHSHPLPTLNNKNYRCGFSSIHQLEKWFASHYRDTLRKLGFKMYILKVLKRWADDDGYQVTFSYPSSKVISIKPIP